MYEREESEIEIELCMCMCVCVCEREREINRKLSEIFRCLCVYVREREGERAVGRIFFPDFVVCGRIVFRRLTVTALVFVEALNYCTRLYFYLQNLP